MFPRSSREPEIGSRPRRAARAGAPIPSRRPRAGGQVVERRADERVTGVAPLGEGGEHEPVGRVGGKVLGRVHRDVGATVEDRLLHLLHEHAGAADAVDRRRRRAGRRWSARSRARPRRRGAGRSGRPASAPARSTSGDTQRSARHAVPVSPTLARGAGRRRAAWTVGVGGGAARVPTDEAARRREEGGERVGVELAPSGARRVLQAHGRLVQQLVDEPARHGVEPGALVGTEVDRHDRSPPAAAPRHARAARLTIGATSRAMLSNRNRSSSSLMMTRTLPISARRCCSDSSPTAFRSSMSRSVHAEHLPDAGVDVARHGDVDDEQRAPVAATHHLFHVGALDERARCTRGREQHVARDERVEDVVERHRTTTRRAPRAPDRGSACGWRRRSRPRPRHGARLPCPRRRRPRRARARAGRRASRAARPRARPPPTRPTPRDGRCRSRVRARLPTSIAWRNVRESSGPAVPSCSAASPRLADLPEDLVLADDHRVEPRGDAEEVRHRGVVVERVQQLGEGVGVDARGVGEEVADVSTPAWNSVVRA